MKPASRQVLLTVLAALAGLCVAVALAILTSHLSSQRIGLAGESPAAGRRLVAPATTSTQATDARRPAKPRKPRPRPIPTPAPAPAPTPTPTVVVPATTVVAPFTHTTSTGNDDHHRGSGDDKRGSDD